MPDLRQESKRIVLNWDLLPARNPPPWMWMSRGVGLSDLASHKSRTLASDVPYLTLAKLGETGTGRLAACFPFPAVVASFLAAFSCAGSEPFNKPSAHTRAQ